MNIEQVKKDLENGIIVSPITYRKLVEAAMIMRDALEVMKDADGSAENCSSAEVLAARVQWEARMALGHVEAL